MTKVGSKQWVTPRHLRYQTKKDIFAPRLINHGIAPLSQTVALEPNGSQKDKSGNKLNFKKLNKEKFNNTAVITLLPGPILDTGFLIIWEEYSGITTRKGYHAL